MELDELKAAWAQQAQRIDQLEVLALQAWQQPRQASVQRRLRWFSGLQLTWLLVWIVVTVLAASFWVEHRQVPQLLLSGLAGVIALSRLGIRVFWDVERPTPRLQWIEAGPVGGLVLLCMALAFAAGPAMTFFNAAAQTLHDAPAYVGSVLPGTSARGDTP